MKLFLGEYDHALDDRGRVTLPRKIRQEIEEREVWEKEAAKQLEAPVTDAKARNLRRYLFAGAEKVEVDKLGRILLPALLKEYAGVTKDVIVVGAGDHFELWDPGKWKGYAAALNTV